MPRPKGSKNKKTIQTVAQVEEQIGAQQKAKAALEARQAEILAVIEEQKKALKDVKKQMRTVDKALLTLEEKKAEAVAIQTAAEKKVEIEKVVTKLISSGRDADEILEMLKK